MTKRPGNLARLLRVIGVCDPAPGVWLGVSADDEGHWDERVPILRDIPTVVRWGSAEPQLKAIDRALSRLDWIVQGGERARPFDVAWRG